MYNSSSEWKSSTWQRDKFCVEKLVVNAPHIEQIIMSTLSREEPALRHIVLLIALS